PMNDGSTPDSASRAGRDGDRRNVTWRPDGAGLSYLQMEPAPRRGADTAATSAPDSGNANASSARAPRRKDRLMLWKAPYDSASTEVVYSSDARISTLEYSADGKIIFVTEGAAGGAGAGGPAGGAPAGGRAGGGATTTQNAIYLSEP